MSVLVTALALVATAVAGCRSSREGGRPTAARPASSTTTAPSAEVISSVVTYHWGWPNNAVRPCAVEHSYPVPPLPVLVKISVGEHYEASPAYDRITFTFTGTFPSYDAQWVSRLVADASGKPIPLDGNDILRIRFTEADAHDATGHSTIVSAPPARVGYKAINHYAQAGDFEGVITYGVANYRTVTESNPQALVRTLEIKKSDGHGGYLYVVAVDIQNRGMGGNPV